MTATTAEKPARPVEIAERALAAIARRGDDAVWISVVPASILLDDLDELLARVPTPADLTGAMVLITGPSRTADIEQILIRGVHGPGEVHVVLVDSETAY